MTSPLPEPDCAALERFAVCSRVEVIGLLRQLLKEGVLFSAHYSQGKALLTALLEVDAQRDLVIIDAASNAEQQRSLLAARDIRFVALEHGIKLQFDTNAVKAMMYRGQPALWLRLPRRVIRLQRREYFRVQPLAMRPVNCAVRAGDGLVVAVWRVLDLSVGGLAFVCRNNPCPYAVGGELRDCTVDLPGEGQFVTGLLVRSTGPVARGGGLRIGCEFVFLAEEARMRLQRFIHHVEAEHRKSAAP